MRYVPYLACVLAAVVVAGCATTDRTLRSSESEVHFDAPRQVQPSEAVLSCFSPDGRLYAVFVPEGDKGVLEVRSFEGDRKLYRQGFDKQAEVLPVLFLNGGRELACVGEKDGVIEILDWGRRSWRSIAAPKAMTIGSIGFPLSLVPLMNDRATMSYLGSCVLTEDGTVTEVRDPRATGGWDPNGRFVYQEAGAWTVIDEAGRESRMQTPVKIDPCPQFSRGDLKLDSESQNLSRRGSDVFATEIWADPAVRPIGIKPDDGASALVFLGYDVSAYGFVPGRNEVFVNSGGGAFLVPFQTAPLDQRRPESENRPD